MKRARIYLATLSVALCLRVCALEELFLPDKDIVIILPENVSLEMVLIKAGQFSMGSPTNEPHCWREEPQHPVTITNDFWIGKFEITQQQYGVVMGEKRFKFPGKRRPADGISWPMAMAYCNTLNRIARDGHWLPNGYQYTLPTEAQWEYACRAGTTTAYNWGPSVIAENGNFRATAEVENTNGTIVVGSYMPNRWGLYDMHGNVEEWCLNSYDVSRLPQLIESPTGNEAIARGGSFLTIGLYVRSAARYLAGKNACCYVFGFRIVLTKACEPVVVPNASTRR